MVSNAFAEALWYIRGETILTFGANFGTPKRKMRKFLAGSSATDC
jgi:hypothetical protein